MYLVALLARVPFIEQHRTPSQRGYKSRGNDEGE
jgi:hypothetical protein